MPETYTETEALETEKSTHNPVFNHNSRLALPETDQHKADSFVVDTRKALPSLRLSLYQDVSATANKHAVQDVMKPCFSAHELNWKKCFRKEIVCCPAPKLL